MTEDKLVDALQTALLENIPNRPPGFLTRMEIQDKTGMNEKKALQHLRLLNRQGKLETTRVYVVNIAGSLSPTPAYKLKE